jgi:hypothetical protein
MDDPAFTLSQRVNLPADASVVAVADTRRRGKARAAAPLALVSTRARARHVQCCGSWRQ